MLDVAPGTFELGCAHLTSRVARGLLNVGSVPIDVCSTQVTVMATETRYKLHEYARRGDLALVREAIENNGNVDQLNRENQTAL